MQSFEGLCRKALDIYEEPFITSGGRYFSADAEKLHEESGYGHAVMGGVGIS